MKKNFTIYLPHYQIGVYVDIYKIDTFWQGQTFHILGGDWGALQLLQLVKFGATDDPIYVRGISNKCENDAFADVYVTTRFSNSIFGLQMHTSGVNGENFGLNNFQLTVYQCWPTCQTCSEHTSKDCLTCYNLASKNVNNECICNDGYFMVIPSNPCTAEPCSTCSLCSSKCKTCNGTSTYCLSCQTPSYLFNNDCITQCPSGFYPRSLDNTCQLCDSSCITCNNAGSNNCLSCIDGYYYSPTPAGSCLRCNLTCNTCVTSANNCTSCKNGSYLFFGSCSSNCPNGYFLQLSNNACQKCDSSCLTCFSSSPNSCFSCPNGFFLTGNNCSACLGCATCEMTTNNCLTCNGSTYLNNNQCIKTCPDGKWARTNDNTCQICNPSCKTCISPGKSNSCSSCVDGSFLANSTCVSCSSS